MPMPYSKHSEKSIPLIEKFRAHLDAVLVEQLTYARDVLGKTRRLHPNEMRRYIPECLRERERDARAFLFAAQS